MPDYCPDDEHLRGVLEANGFRVVECEVVRNDGRLGRYLVLPTDPKAILKAAWSALDHIERARAEFAQYDGEGAE
jgi:hypothetical protein